MEVRPVLARPLDGPPFVQSGAISEAGRSFRFNASNAGFAGARFAQHGLWPPQGIVAGVRLTKRGRAKADCPCGQQECFFRADACLAI